MIVPSAIETVTHDQEANGCTPQRHDQVSEPKKRTVVISEDADHYVSGKHGHRRFLPASTSVFVNMVRAWLILTTWSTLGQATLSLLISVIYIVIGSFKKDKERKKKLRFVLFSLTLRKDPCINVLLPIVHCPNSSRPPPPSVKQVLWNTFSDPIFSSGL